VSAPNIGYEAGAYVVKTAPAVVEVRRCPPSGGYGVEIVTLKIGPLYYVSTVLIDGDSRYPGAWNERPSKASAATAADALAAL
jgi:hypothetical protein